MSDLLVVGGGPAGLATALYAVRAGLQVSVWDRRAGVIDKACGEGLMPGAVAALADLGVEPTGQELRGIRYVAGTRSVDAGFRDGHGRGVRRTTLHAALREVTASCGVLTQARSAGEIRQDETGVTVDGERFAHVVAADGLHSGIRRRLGLELPGGSPRRFGLRRHYRVAPWSSYVEVHWAPAVEAYVTPVGADEVGVALLTTSRGSFEEQLRRLPSLRGHLEGATEAGEVLGAGPLRQRARLHVAGRVLLVGDAAGYVDALTGEGIALAVAQARAAVAAIVDDETPRYESDWHTITRRYRLLTASLLAATQVPPLRRLLVPAAARLPSLFGMAVNSLARPA